jgi:hypothetical protein
MASFRIGPASDDWRHSDTRGGSNKLGSTESTTRFQLKPCGTSFCRAVPLFPAEGGDQ